ncbi:MAG: homocysteine S-methyltransferase family protein [Bacteroidota bacterium]
MGQILSLLESGKVLVSDGAMGTELFRHGKMREVCLEQLNFTRPELIQLIHQNYLKAGSDIIQTNSFGANRARLANYGLEECSATYSRRAAEIARAVCPPDKFVAGSIGPTGEMFSPAGQMTQEEAFSIFAEQAQALSEGGADILFIETMTSAEEAVTALSAAKKTTNLSVAVSMSFELVNGHCRTIWGEDAARVVARLEKEGADIIGANCGRGIDEMISVIRTVRPLTSRPVIAQPNAGLPEWTKGRCVYRESPAEIKERAEILIRSGVNIIGGCCGTTPEHISVFRKIADSINKSPQVLQA